MNGFRDFNNAENMAIDLAIREITPYRAIVSDVNGDLISFVAVDADTVDVIDAPQLDTGETLIVTDEILVIGRRNPIVLGRILR